MSENKKDLEILSELAKEIAEEKLNKPEMLPIDDICEQENKNTNIHGKKTKDKNKPTLTPKQLAIKRHNQNLAERKTLLRILAALLGIQLIFMNLVVAGIVVWSLFDWNCFRQLNVDVLKSILDFSKYYVTAVLVELLSGVIYMVHKVFSFKD